MAATKGMLSGLFAPQARDPEEEADDKRAQQLAQMSPFEANAYTAYSGGAQAGRGLGKVLGAATGHDLRTPVQKRGDAIEAAKAQVAQMGFDPEDPKSIDQFYKNVIQILQKQGLAGEAMDVAKEWHAQKATDEKNAAARAETQRKADADAARALQAKERNAALIKNGLPELEAPFYQLDSLVPDSLKAELEQIKADIIAGKIKTMP